MRIPEFAVKYRVTVSMIFICIVLLGTIAFYKLNIDLLPNIEFPKISVITEYQNATPGEVRDLITKPIEESLGSVGGIKSISSKSIEGLSIVILTFEWNTDMNIAMLSTSENSERIRPFLPQDTGKPVIIKFDPSSSPIYSFSIQSKNISQEYFGEFLKKEVQAKLERIRGVGNVNLIGAQRRLIDVEVDLHSLYAYKTSLNEIMSSIKTSNYDFPAGNIEKGDREYLVRTVGKYKKISQIGQTIIKSDEKGTPIYLNQVAKISDGFEEQKSIALIDGSESIIFEVKKEAGANTVEVVSLIENVLDDVRQKFDRKIMIKEIYNASSFIKESIFSVLYSALFGGFLAFIILMIFLRELHSAVIVVVGIPVAIFSTFIFMYFYGLSINMMSLGGLALGIGMLVDNNIIVLENIYRLREEGLELLKACVIGVKSVQTSIIGSTLTSIIVFLPLIFLKGLIGALFKEMAYVIAFSLISSIFVSILLIPMLASYGSNLKKEKNKLLFKKNSKGYFLSNFFSEQIFKIILKKKFIFLLTILVILIFSFFIFGSIKTEIMPKVHEQYLSAIVKMPEGTKIEKVTEVNQLFSRKLMQKPFIQNVFVTIGYEDDDFFSKLNDAKGKNIGNYKIIIKSNFSIEEAYQILRKEKMVQIESVSFFKPADIIGRILSDEEKSIIIGMQGRRTDSIALNSKDFYSKLKQIKGITDAGISLKEDRSEIKIEIDRDKLAMFQLDVYSVAQILKSAIQGEKISKFYAADTPIDIRIRLLSKYRYDYEQIFRMLIPISEENYILLSDFADLKEDIGNDKILRENQSDIIYIKANYDATYYSSYRNAIKPIEDLILREKMNTSNLDLFDIEIMGEEKQFQESISQLLFMFLFSLIFIYMIIASLFESISLPFILFSSILLGFIGVAPVLYLSGMSINIMSGMGIIMLGGITINSAVILMEFIQQEQKNFPIQDVLVRAIKIRLRPILMSVSTTVLGLLPLCFATGSGSDMQQPLAITVVSGLMISTLLTLIVVPILYSFYWQWKKKKEIL